MTLSQAATHLAEELELATQEGVQLLLDNTVDKGYAPALKAYPPAVRAYAFWSALRNLAETVYLPVALDE